MISTLSAKHGPEIAYLSQGTNGLLTADTPVDFSQAAIRLFQDERLYDSMSLAARKSSESYSLDCMVANFVDGIGRCLKQ